MTERIKIFTTIRCSSIPCNTFIHLSNYFDDEQSYAINFTWDHFEQLVITDHNGQPVPSYKISNINLYATPVDIFELIASRTFVVVNNSNIIGTEIVTLPRQMKITRLKLHDIVSNYIVYLTNLNSSRQSGQCKCNVEQVIEMLQKSLVVIAREINGHDVNDLPDQENVTAQLKLRRIPYSIGPSELVMLSMISVVAIFSIVMYRTNRLN